MEHAYWGPGYTAAEIRSSIEASAVSGGGYTLTELAEAELLRRTAAIIGEGKILGWYQGRAEWGPRAFGNRSIVADPRRPEMKEILNQRIKHREIFRPFAPSILAEKTGEWFEKALPLAVHDLGLFGAAGKTRQNSRADARGRHGPLADRYARERIPVTTR